MSSPRWLTCMDAVDRFPNPNTALTEPNGLLAAGGDLEPDRLLGAYVRGIFPWYEQGQPILWWSPDPRAVLWPAELHISRSLKRSLIKGGFELRVDSAFDQVVAGCAAPRRYTDATWITADMARAYGRLYRMGWAHSFETWRGGELVGGLYGVAIGQVFFGESMFSQVTDASKVALVGMVRFLEQRGFALIDCQVASQHTTSLGARTIPRREFLRLLELYCRQPGTPQSWHTAAP